MTPFQLAKQEWVFGASIVTTTLFFLFGNRWLADLSNPAWFAFILIWLFVVILLRHSQLSDMRKASRSS